MLGTNVPWVTAVFLALALLFMVLAVRDYLREEGRPTLARKAWLRMALIFSAVAVGLVVWHTYFA